MKIRDIEPLIIDNGTKKHWIFVKVTTDEGIEGWGECYSQSDREEAIVSHIRQFARYLPGRDPFQIKYISTMLRDDYMHRRGSMEFYSAFSGVEMALWDILGKACNQPVYNLLGGRYRDRIRVYANGWAYHVKTPDDIARAAEGIVARGFTALKFDPFGLPVRTHITREHERRAIAMVAAVRDAIGPDVDMLVECSRRLNPKTAVRFAGGIDHLSPYWIEEPIPAFDTAGLAEVRQASSAAVVTGETLYTKDDFRAVFETRCVDIINPDIAACCGILELKEIAAAAEPYMIAVSPHNYNSTTVALAATMQASAGMPNFLLTEYFMSFDKLGAEICEDPLVPIDGYIALRDKPGLGLTLDEAKIRRMIADGTPLRSFRSPADEA